MHDLKQHVKYNIKCAVVDFPHFILNLVIASDAGHFYSHVSFCFSLLVERAERYT